MIAVAIVAILAAMALPPMTNGIVRKQIVDAAPMADFVKAAVQQSWSTLNALPADNAGAGLPAAAKIVGNYVSAVNVANGAIHITFGNSANPVLAGKVLTLRPAVVLDAPAVPIAWVCAHASVPSGMTVVGDDRTDIPVAMLPYNCTGSGK